MGAKVNILEAARNTGKRIPEIIFLNNQKSPAASFTVNLGIKMVFPPVTGVGK